MPSTLLCYAWSVFSLYICLDAFSELQQKCIHLVVLKRLLTVVDRDLQITAAESSGDYSSACAYLYA